MSTITWRVSVGFIALFLTAMLRLSCKRDDPLLAHAAAPARHRRAVERQVVAEELLAGQTLEIQVLDPADAQRLVRQVEGVLEDGEPRY